MTRPLTRAACLFAAATLAVPAAAEISPIDMASVLREGGCRTEVAEVQARVDAQGLAANDVQAAMATLFALGASTVADDGALWLERGYCGLTGSATEIDVLVAAMRLNGCQMTESQAEFLLAPMGLDRTNTTPAVEALVADGMATLVDDTVFTLGAELCAGADGIVGVAAVAPSDPGDSGGDLTQLLIAIASENGCEIDEDTAEREFPLRGIDMGTAEDAAEEMIAMGRARFDADVFTILPPLCTPAEDGTQPQLEASDPVALRNAAWPAFQALFQAHGCGMAFEPASLIAGDYGLDIDAADELADELMDAGLAEVGGDVLMLDPSVCTPSPDSDANFMKLDLMMTMMSVDCSTSLLDLTSMMGVGADEAGAMQRAMLDMIQSGRLRQEGLNLVLDHPNCG